MRYRRAYVVAVSLDTGGQAADECVPSLFPETMARNAYCVEEQMVAPRTRIPCLI